MAVGNSPCRPAVEAVEGGDLDGRDGDAVEPRRKPVGVEALALGGGGEDDEGDAADLVEVRGDLLDDVVRVLGKGPASALPEIRVVVERRRDFELKFLESQGKLFFVPRESLPGVQRHLWWR